MIFLFDALKSIITYPYCIIFITMHSAFVNKCTGNGGDWSGWCGPHPAAGCGGVAEMVAETDYG
jgi:hypothetical protein